MQKSSTRSSVSTFYDELNNLLFNVHLTINQFCKYFFADRSSLTSVVKPEQQRPSVIVNRIQFSSQTQDIVRPSEFPQLTSPAHEPVKFNMKQSQEQGKDKEGVNEVEELVLPTIDMVELKNIQTTCISFLAEASPFMRDQRELFYNAWYQVGTPRQ